MMVEISSASEFINILRPSNDNWWSDEWRAPTHVFRGHADKDWELVPSAFRSGTKLKPLLDALERLMRQAGHKDPGMDSGARESQQNLIWHFALAEAVYRFVRLARDVGLSVNFAIPHTYLGPHTFQTGLNLPPPVPVDLIALAQHHGIPTRLLDWTIDPLHAAYFATGTGNETSDLCVWALDISETFTQTPMGQLELFWPATLGNDFMKAQMGAFVGYLNTESIVRDDYAPIAARCTKFVLAADQRTRLRELLFRERRSLAHIMPSWDNVAATAMLSWSSLA